jgi:sigma-E factor negative regulatory protein RseC
MRGQRALTECSGDDLYGKEAKNAEWRYSLQRGVIIMAAAEEEGMVTAIEGAYALVKVVRTTSCAHCPSAGVCHIESDREMIVKARNSVGARIGQRVQLFIAPGSILAASFLLYIIPLFGLIFGAVAGKLVLAHVWPRLSSELLAAGAGLITMAGTLAGIRFYDRRRKSNERFMPKIIQVL